MSARGPGPRNRLPCRCHKPGAPRENSNPLQRDKFPPAPVRRTAPGTPVVAGKYLSGTARSKAGFLERPERRRSFRARPNGADLTPPARGFCRDRKCSFHFREEEVVLKRVKPGAVPRGIMGNVVFLVLAPPALHAYWPSKLKIEAGETTFFSSPAHRCPPPAAISRLRNLFTP